MTSEPTPPEDAADAAGASLRIRHVLEVLEEVREAVKRGETLSVARRKATLSVAERRGIDERTVADKCWRQLALPSIGEFDRLVEAWLARDDPGLRRLLESRATAAHRDGDLSLIGSFFDGGSLPPVTDADPSTGGAGRDDRLAALRAVRTASGPRASLRGRDLVDHAHAALVASGFLFRREDVADFYLCLRAKPFVLLTGISGTGKTALARQFARACGFACDLVAVRPDWNDPGDLLGYPDLEERFVPGRLVEFLVAAREEPERPRLLLLDEMNLARVEHYFAGSSGK